MSNTTQSTTEPSNTVIPTENTDTFFTSNTNDNTQSTNTNANIESTTAQSTDNDIKYTLTDAEIKEFKERFNEFDQNKDGKISISELKSMEISLGMNPTSHHLQTEFAAGDIDHNGYIDFNEFCIGMQKQKEKDLKKTETEIKNTFNQFDYDKNGFIDEIELKQGFETLGLDKTDSEFDNMMLTYDINHDRLLSYTEFYKLVLNEASNNENNNNENNNHSEFKFNLPSQLNDIDPMYLLFGGCILGLCLLICILRCICKCCCRKRGKVKIYNALSTRVYNDDEHADLMYEI